MAVASFLRQTGRYERVGRLEAEGISPHLFGPRWRTVAAGRFKFRARAGVADHLHMLLCPSNFASETLAAGGDLRSGDLASKLALTSHLVTVRPERLGDLAVNDRRVPASMVRGL